MDKVDVILHEEQAECEKCKEYAADEMAYGVAILSLAFIGPLIGMLIGLFVGKKLAQKDGHPLYRT